jgi:hypothetical protein
VLVLPEHAADYGAVMVWTARGGGKRLDWLTRPYFALQLAMGVEPAEIVESERGRLELVGPMSASGSAAVERGAGVVPGVKLLNMMTLPFSVGPLEWSLVQVEMPRQLVACVSGVGTILALGLAARKHGAGLT